MKIITGMHRSGTSFTANILYHLGIPLNAPSVIPADCWNAAGYYENLNLIMLNDRIILGNWPGLQRFRQTPSGARPAWLIAWISLYKLRYLIPRTNSSISKRARLLQDELINFAAQNKYNLLKDPRFSLTIKSWHDYTEIDSILYSFRHPLETAQSLHERERIPLWLGMRIWACHVETFLSQKGDLPVTYINFNNFFNNSLAIGEVKRCFNFAGQSYNKEKAVTLLEKCMNKNLKRQHATADTLPPRYCRLYKKLQDLHT